MITLSKHPILLVVTYLCSIILPALSVRRGDFKTCDQASFCKRNRARATRAQSAEFSPSWRSPYRIAEPPVWMAEERTLRALLTNELYPHISFALNASFVSDSEGTMRIKVDQVGGLRQRYNEADRWTLLRQPSLTNQDDLKINIETEQTVVDWGQSLEHDHLYRFSLSYHPLLVTLYKDGVPHIVLNERGLFNMEHFREKSAGQDPAALQDGLNIHESSDGKVAPPIDLIHPGFKDVDEEGMWDENFGGRTDSKPKGPESLSLDITFPGYQHVYGIPEHASPLSLKTTRGTDSANKEAYTDPYRLWNLDVFEYEADSEMALYGAIPFMKAHRAGSTVGVFWLNAAETWIDVEKIPTKAEVMRTWKQGKAQKKAGIDQGPNAITTTTHWMSESGILDLFLFLGPSSRDIFSSFGSLVGTTLMPPYFSIAHHQCRWNYVSQEDLLDVISNFDKHDIPLDVIWLDIEYAEEHKYFVWDKKAFPDPLKMIATLEATGRKLVTIVDPHLKRSSDYYVYKEAVEHDVLVKLPDGSEYEGWCWTGSSSWTDYFNPKTWDWWAGLFKFNKYRESTVNVHNWLDMNEPSVFNAPEITLPRDNIHFGGWEHRDVHNLNGMLTHNQSNRGLQERTSPPMRGFVLSRSYFAGSQRYGAIWQGDNMGTWDHLKVSIPMLLSNAIAGMAFNGADVGGFFGNPSNEMLVRWYQAGAFFPFFRAHAHIDTKRREPYLFDEPFRGYMVGMIKLRYTLLPVWYTSFFENTFTGVPMTVPQYVMFPDDEGWICD
ncbi:family 31 glycoside hydrolase [Melampsora larici-populina 98AG31]|uniref:Glucosidase II subunit alpha n=1 Tax=Melampsora larici-populina (strain 98AG31 / pathotype 3-4-7) TaxID=747676 RepID=F4RRC7_MELLP|nr:family 31 glycoside hydrolase [Melampsora larici-populina 98AG31]EGG04914.1 family 31 glycoside hydrolase [Melampsora larici-populina 98AG31]